MLLALLDVQMSTGQDGWIAMTMIYCACEGTRERAVDGLMIFDMVMMMTMARVDICW